MKLSGLATRGVSLTVGLQFEGVTSLHYHRRRLRAQCLGLSHRFVKYYPSGNYFDNVECSPNLQLKTGIRKSRGGFLVATADPLPSDLAPADKGPASRATRVWRWQ